jgi:hypothetical protein
MSSSTSPQWVPCPRPINRQFRCCSGVASNSRGTHASGTASSRPSAASLFPEAAATPTGGLRRAASCTHGACASGAQARWRCHAGRPSSALLSGISSSSLSPERRVDFPAFVHYHSAALKGPWGRVARRFATDDAAEKSGSAPCSIAKGHSIGLFFSRASIVPASPARASAGRSSNE